MQKVLSNPIIINLVPSLNVVLKNTFVEREFMSRLVQLLLEVKRASTLVKLVTKHANFMALVSGSLTTMLRKKT
jgi:hypothetical protein